MFKKSRSRWGLFALVLVLSLAFTAMTTASAVTGPAGTLSLHVANGSGVFTYTPTSGGAQIQQPLPAPNKCGIGNPLNGNLVDIAGSLSATGAAKPVGLVGSSIGVKGSSTATGTACGRVDAAEAMTLTLDNVPNAGSVALDLELKGGANVQIVFKLGTSTVGTFQIRSGSSIVSGEGKDGNTDGPPFSVALIATEPIGNCRNASDSGPDSGGNDNCRVSITPASEFDTVEFRALAGEFSLEGGGDAGTSDTVFNLVASFEGEIGCASGNNVATDDGGDVEARITRHQNTVASQCVLKPYNLTATENDGVGPSVTFDVADPVSPAQKGAYEALLTFDQPLTNALSAKLTYDPAPPYIEGDFDEIPPCGAAPLPAGADDPTGSINDEAIPTGHTACVADVSQSWDGKTVWHVFFTADIKFR